MLTGLRELLAQRHSTAPKLLSLTVERFVHGVRHGLPHSELRRVAKQIPDSAVFEPQLASDPWLANYALNVWEEAQQIDVLRSYPWKVALPIADLCNARCTFCTSWLAGRKVLSLDQLERYTEVLPFARSIGLQGHGEPLANPHIDAILKRLAEVTDRRATSYIISNGIFLERRVQALLDAHVQTFNFSLNAVSKAMHHRVMGLGENALDVVLSGIKKLVALRRDHPGIQITISMVLTADNFHEAPDFIQMGNDLGVDWLYLRTLAPVGELQPGLNYHALPPMLRPDFDAVKERIVKVAQATSIRIDMQPDTWHLDALSPSLRAHVVSFTPTFISRAEAAKNREIKIIYDTAHKTKVGRGHFKESAVDDGFNPFGRSPPFPCEFVYQQLISTHLNFRIVPCCYMTDVPGYEPVTLLEGGNFEDYWNCDAFVNLRRSLSRGPLMAPCKTCPMQG